MRIIFAVVCGILIAGNTTAWAADCGKGLLWPFIRSAGECLTQTEKSQGITGVFGGAGDARKPASPPQTPAPPQANAATASAVVSSTEKVSATPVAAPAAPAPAQASSGTAAPSTAAVSCQKGWLWPFVREPGDCLTDQDRKNGLER